MTRKIKVLDVTLRDGQHQLSHTLPAEKMAIIAEQIDNIGLDSIEFGHGNGLGGSSFQYGFGASTDLEYIKTVSSVVKKTRLSVITLPGIGTRQELQMAMDHGVQIVRFCTQISECDIAEQHIAMAKKMGFEVRAVLPCASMLTVAETAYYAKRSEDFGADAVYLLDGGGICFPIWFMIE